MIKNKIILIDFCETLVSIQTADDFVYFVLKDKFLRFSLLRLCKSVLSFRIVLILLRCFSIRPNYKVLSVLFLKGLNEKLLFDSGQKYAEIVLSGKKNLDVLKKINSEYSNDRKIIISGGYLYYIKPFAELINLNVSDYLCSILDVDSSNKLIGKIKFDCMEQNKVIALENLRIENFHSSELITFTDSLSDLPLIKISNLTHYVHESNIRYNISKNQ